MLPVPSAAASFRVGLALATGIICAGEASAPAADLTTIEEVVVRASVAQRLGELGSGDTLDAEEITAIGATHVNETMNRVPGVWITRGSGQEHLTAIRSAVFTGAGACGEFLYLEDGLPIRPAGFCNVNNLFELNTEQAGAIEVWRGPAGAVLGGNAVHGAINVHTHLPAENSLAIEGGPYDYYRIAARVQGTLGRHRLGVTGHGVSTNGYRDATGYGQQKVTMVHQIEAGRWQVRNALTATLLNQETGGFVYGFEAYKDSDLRRTNPNPEAFRDAWSVRLASRLQRGPWQVVPYWRRSAMRFLQHFLPGQPLETNDQTSGGVLAGYDWHSGSAQWHLGTQIELLSGSLKEYQAEALTTSSAFNNAVRPAGVHYDYDVDGLMLAGFYQLNYQMTDVVRLVHGLRFERLEYDYENKSLNGNTRDDGTPCSFGGCLYNRPASRSDAFDNVAGRIGAEAEVGGLLGHLVFGTGFRPPQATELYRLQRGQEVADLDSERLSSLEAGVRGRHWSLAAFVERTRHFIFRDAAGFNVSDGRTKSHGVEFSGALTLGRHAFEVSGTYAEHRYDFDRAADQRELIESGNLMDTAPRWLANGRWRFDPNPDLVSEVEIDYQGKHYLDAANTATYDGHLVVNWRGSYRVRSDVTLFARVINLLDRKYADRADFTLFNPLNYRYFPAMPRQVYVGARIVL